jgi:mRNA-degrading endonuclease RelE of RelBE toxin-antitoxin system
MFEIVIKPTAQRQLARLRRFHAISILDAIQLHLSHEPERTSRSRIKKLRGRQGATFRLRVGDYRVFYDVVDSVVTIVAVMHKAETARFYKE